ncbi:MULTISPECIES: hypothetical protein [unclassified Sphingobium]|uniref:hypothetical protein n=1 Tax=unclassified Sphingobium TaxID=2611147 RepID=UPI00222573F2|nr:MULTISPECIES: hypothetical protein [unclassified Sphingobium]MCW2411753.1 hypothetical protein [Sphingobium sp. B8D3D]MCW2415951.1 hypothetical protein [Sphingobium sp. B8D3A]
MSDRALTFLACPADLDSPAPALGWLARAERLLGRSASHQFVLVSGKVKLPSGMRSFNIEMGYPAEPAHLITHAAWAWSPGRHGPQYRDARALFCLSRFVSQHPEADEIALILGEPGESVSPSDGGDPPPLAAVLSSTKDGGGTCDVILFDRKAPNADIALAIATDMALSGAIYSVEPYSLSALLDEVARATAFLADCASER